jgi:hypothetical protein
VAGLAGARGVAHPLAAQSDRFDMVCACGLKNYLEKSSYKMAYKISM